jgi:hypothetical protein
MRWTRTFRRPAWIGARADAGGSDAPLTVEARNISDRCASGVRDREWLEMTCSAACRCADQAIHCWVSSRLEKRSELPFTQEDSAPLAAVGTAAG